MGVTVVISGPDATRAQAVAQLRQAGHTVDPIESRHGFDALPEHSFITVHAGHPDQAAAVVDHLGWSLRSHWASTGEWKKLGHDEASDALKELAKLKAQLRANGMKLDD
jgi:hypothetical protein